VEEAYKHGIVTYIDAVLNHKFGADEAQKVPVREVDSNDRTQFTTDVYEIEVRWLGYSRYQQLADSHDSA
jgi:alpha-amylase